MHKQERPDRLNQTARLRHVTRCPALQPTDPFFLCVHIVRTMLTGGQTPSQPLHNPFTPVSVRLALGEPVDESLNSRVRRFRRAISRGRSSARVPLAQRPRTSTTTTSTTTSTTSTSITTSTPTTSAPLEDTGATAEESTAGSVDDTGDYEDLEPSKSKARPAASSSGAADRSKARGETENSAEAGESVEEETNGEEGEEEEEQEEISAPTSTTTQRTTTSARRSDKSARKGSSKAKSGSGGRARGEKQRSSKSKSDSDETEEASEQTAARETTTESAASSSSVKGKSARNASEAPAPGHAPLHHKKRPLVALPFIKPKNLSVCIPEAYLEFPRDLIGDKWRSRGLILVHLCVVCYMFYSLALVCERYFMPSLEEFALRLQISEDVAGATLMSAGSSAPELFTAVLGVFVAKGDVGTGAIVGSAVFNILFVIGVCAFVSTTSAQLQWWPVLRDSLYYTFTVLVLIVIIYDERVTAFESATMIGLYGVYIAVMAHNDQLKEATTRLLLAHPLTAKLISSSQSISIEGPDDVFGGSLSSAGARGDKLPMNSLEAGRSRHEAQVEEDSIFLAACLVIVRHKRLFRRQLRFQSAARYIIVKHQHRVQLQKQSKSSAAKQQPQQQHNEEVNYFGPETSELLSGGGGTGARSKAQRTKMEAYARNATLSKNKFSIVSKDDYEFWHRPPEEGENYYLWLAKIPVNFVLHYTIPDCSLEPDRYLLAFFASIMWTALFSYVMVWMVTIIGYTLGIPDSVMGVTFLAAGTSVPDCYSSIHAARNGMADMAVSNSIGSNVFDILIGLAVPWFIQSAVYPGVVATINSRGVIYSVILLFLSLLVTIYLMNRADWNLQPRLGLALILAYVVFIILTCMLEFNLFGHVNPPPCPPAAANANY